MLSLFTPQEMGRIDRAAPAAGAPIERLMEAAGRAVARFVMRTCRPTRTLVLLGPGNNGGDGLVAARLLAACGWPVAVAPLAPLRDIYPASLWRGPVAGFTPDEAARAGLVIDALFGAGLTRPLPAEAEAVLRAADRIIAVDVPSGLDGGTGLPRGFAPQCEATVTFVARKPGHLLLPGRDLCGRLHVADIGMPAAAIAAVTPTNFANEPGLWVLPPLRSGDHKYTRGHVTVLGGAVMTGAARLAADAARHVGAGLVTVSAPDPGPYRLGPPGLIVTDETADALAADVRRNAWVVGPGLGVDAARAAIDGLRGRVAGLVADADALAAHAGAPEGLHGAAVLTPHAGEFAKLFGAPDGDRLSAARAAARRVDAVVLLKGSDTIIAAPDGRAAINHNAPPALATAGAGDVLTGIIAGLIAQGMEAWPAACAGAWLHGEAARLALGGLKEGLLAEAIAPRLAEARARAGRAEAPRAGRADVCTAEVRDE